MRLIDRHIGLTVIASTLLVLAVLMAMFTFFTLVDELGDMGRGSYGAMDAVIYVLQSLPRRTFEVFPLAALIGSLLGLGGLASGSELTVIRAAGVSINRIAVAVMKGGAVLMVMALVLGEVVAPPLDARAEQERARKMDDRALYSADGIWSRDGSSVINIRNPVTDEQVRTVRIYEFDEDRKLRTMTYAEEAVFNDGVWLLRDIAQTRIGDQGVQTNRLARARWESDLVPALIGVARVEPERLSMVGLVRYIRHLEANDQDSSPYQLGLWSKVMTPLSTGVMIFLAIPFVFGPLRSASMGSRILVGTLAGIGFYIFNQVSMKLGLVYGFTPSLAATLPTLVVAGLGVWMMRRTV